MREPQSRSWVWSLSLILGGVVLLLFNFGLLEAYAPWPQAVLAGCCALAAAGFFIAFARRRQEWWRLLPAWTLAALAGMVLSSLLAGVDRSLIAAQVFGGLALAFGNIYLLARRERWWAILPGGFMLVLAVVVGASRWIADLQLLAALLFGGLGLVFFLLYLLDGGRRQWWALIPGSVLLVFGALALTAPSLQEGGLVRWWPLVLVAAGLLIWAGGRRSPQRGDKFENNTAPRRPAPRPVADSAAKGSTKPAPRSTPGAVLGEYTQPAPGASIDILPDSD
jgi:uncharacterized membrane protein YfcA